MGARKLNQRLTSPESSAACQLWWMLTYSASRLSSWRHAVACGRRSTHRNPTAARVRVRRARRRPGQCNPVCLAESANDVTYDARSYGAARGARSAYCRRPAGGRPRAVATDRGGAERTRTHRGPTGSAATERGTGRDSRPHRPSSRWSWRPVHRPVPLCSRGHLDRRDVDRSAAGDSNRLGPVRGDRLLRGYVVPSAPAVGPISARIGEHPRARLEFHLAGVALYHNDPRLDPRNPQGLRGGPAPPVPSRDTVAAHG